MHKEKVTSKNFQSITKGRKGLIIPMKFIKKTIERKRLILIILFIKQERIYEI